MRLEKEKGRYKHKRFLHDSFLENPTQSTNKLLYTKKNRWVNAKLIFKVHGSLKAPWEQIFL